MDDWSANGRDEYGCINTRAHFDNHINKARNGKLISWEDVTPYDDEGKPIEDMEEIDEKEISEKEVLEILRKNYGGNIPEVVMEIINRE